MKSLLIFGSLTGAFLNSPLVARATAGEQDPSGKGGVMDFNLDAAIIQLILFVLVILVLGKYVWPPILRGLQAREGKIRQDLEQAEKAAADAAATLDQYQAQLAEAQREANRIVAQSQADARDLAARLKEQTQRQITSLKQRAEVDINAAKRQCIAEIHEQTAVLATQVAGQILQREIKAAEHDVLVQQVLGQMAEQSR